MTVLKFTNTGYGRLPEYIEIIEERLGKKINYDKEGEFYYYVIYALDDLLDIVRVLPYECIISKEEDDIYNTFNLEVYDDWRE